MRPENPLGWLILEGEFEQINARLGAIEDRLGRFDDRLGRVEDKIANVRTELLSRMDRQFYWILSLLVVSILVPVFLPS